MANSRILLNLRKKAKYPKNTPVVHTDGRLGIVEQYRPINGYKQAPPNAYKVRWGDGSVSWEKADDLRAV